jgi:hypothetical protein
MVLSTTPLALREFKKLSKVSVTVAVQNFIFIFGMILASLVV